MAYPAEAHLGMFSRTWEEKQKQRQPPDGAPFPDRLRNSTEF